jgi:hypothetical protein
MAQRTVLDPLADEARTSSSSVPWSNASGRLFDSRLEDGHSFASAASVPARTKR